MTERVVIAVKLRLTPFNLFAKYGIRISAGLPTGYMLENLEIGHDRSDT
jgi:hypothetical protein